MGCTSSKQIRPESRRQDSDPIPKPYKGTEPFRASAMVLREPNNQAARLFEREKALNKHRTANRFSWEGRANEASITTMFDKLAARGVIDRDALKRGSYMPPKH